MIYCKPNGGTSIVFIMDKNAEQIRVENGASSGVKNAGFLTLIANCKRIVLKLQNGFFRAGSLEPFAGTVAIAKSS